MVEFTGISYSITADASGLDRAAPVIRKLDQTLKQLDKTVKQMSSAFASEMQKAGNSSRQSGEQTRAAAERAKTALQKQQTAIVQARQRMEELNAAVKRAGGDSLLLANNTKAFNVLERALSKGALSATEFANRKARFNNVLARARIEVEGLTRAQREAEKADRIRESSLQRQENSLERIRIKYLDFRKALEETKASPERIQQLDRSFASFEERMNSGVLSSRDFNRAQNDVNAKFGEVRRSSNLTSSKLESLRLKMTELTKSVQIALGPLSGVAARLTAFSSLAGTATLRIAGLITGFIGLAVFIGKSVNAAASFEQEMLRINAILRVTENRIGFTSEQIDTMARKVGRLTLTSQTLGRTAAASLLTVKNLPSELFEDTLEIAQGMSLIGRGDMVSNLRRLKRLLEDPANNLKSLSEQGIFFNAVQEDMIKSLARQGDHVGALKEAYKELLPLQEAALEEGKGLKGSWDELAEATTDLLSTFGVESGLLKLLTILVTGLAKVTVAANKTLGAIVNLIGVVPRFVSQARSMLIDSLDLDLKFNIGSLFGSNKPEGALKATKTQQQLLQEQFEKSTDTLVDFRNKFLDVIVATKESKEELVRFKNDLLDLDEKTLSKVIESLDITREQFDRLAFVMQNRLQDPIEKFIFNLRDEIQVAFESVRISKLLGNEKHVLSTEQTVLNKVMELGNIHTREQAKLLSMLSPEERDRIKRIKELSRVLSDLERINKEINITNTLSDDFRMARAEADLVTASNVKRQKAISRISHLLDRLREGASNEALIRELELIDRINDEDIRKFHRENVRGLMEGGQLIDHQLKNWLLTEQLRTRNLALEKKRIELIKQYGSLQDEMAAKEMALFEQNLRSQELLEKFLSLSEAVEGGFEKIGLAINDAIINGLEEGQTMMDLFKQTALEALRDIQKELFKTFVLDPIKNQISRSLQNAIGGIVAPTANTTAGSINWNTTSSLPKAARGAVIGGRGIVTTKRGEMIEAGEKGREAILPLNVDSSGNLGVSGSIMAKSEEPKVFVQVFPIKGTKADVQEQTIGNTKFIKIVMSEMDQRIRDGNFDSAFQRYGLQPRVGSR